MHEVFKESIVHFSFSFRRFIWVKFLILLGLLATLGHSVPHKHQRSHSAIHQPFEIEQPWIGSHILKFTPNPFLNSIPQTKQLNDESESHIRFVSTAKSPLSPTSAKVPIEIEADNNNVTDPKSTSSMGKRGRKIRRKVKGRRRLSSARRNANRYQRKSRKMDETKNRFRARRPRVKIELPNKSGTNANTENEETNPIENEFNVGKIEFLPIDQVSQKFRPRNLETTTEPDHTITTVPATILHQDELVMITAPPPIKAEVVDPKTNLIPIDLIDHPEKLNPSYFRNIILKTMMDKLVGLKIVTHAPTLIRTPLKS